MSGKRKPHNRKRRPETMTDAVTGAQVIFFTVLRDKEGYEVDDLRRVWDGIEKLSEEIIEGRVSVTDLKHVLREEAGIRL